MDAILSATAVSVSYGGVHALRDVTLEVPASGRVALIGPNGAGKSTLVNVLSGVIRPREGQVHYEGQRLGPTHRAARRGLIRTFQNLELFPTMTVLENVLVALDGTFRAHPAQRRGRSATTRRDLAMEALDTFGLADRAEHVVSSLAYGTRKLVELSRAIAANPSIVLLDEPVAGLTAKTEYVEALVKGLDSRGTAALLVEHDMTTVERLADTVHVLDSGSIIASGDYASVSHDPRVIEAYLGSDEQLAE